MAHERLEIKSGDSLKSVFAMESIQWNTFYDSVLRLKVPDDVHLVGFPNNFIVVISNPGLLCTSSPGPMAGSDVIVLRVYVYSHILLIFLLLPIPDFVTLNLNYKIAHRVNMMN